PPRRPRLVRGQHARGTRDGAALVPLLPRGGRGSLTLAALRRHPLRAGADPGAGPGGLRRHPRDHRRPYPALTAPASRGAWPLYDEAAGPLRTGADRFVVARLRPRYLGHVLAEAVAALPGEDLLGVVFRHVHEGLPVLDEDLAQHLARDVG